MKRTLLSLVVAGALGGCQTTPQTIYRTVEVKVPVRVPCKAPDVPKPSFALDAVGIEQGIYPKGAAALAEIRQRQSYEDRLEAALQSCR